MKKSSRKALPPSLWISTGVAALSSFLFGYHSGIMAVILIALRTPLGLSPVSEGFLMATLVMGAILGTLLFPYVTNRLGSKGAVACTAWGFAISNGLLVCATSFGSLCCGRLGAGVCVGLTALAVPLYLAELAPIKRRGLLVSLAAFSVVFGIFVAYSVSLLTPLLLHWRILFVIALALSIVQLCVISLLDEPRPALPTQAAHPPERCVWSEPSLRKPLGIGIGLNVLQQFVGINAIIYYAPLLLPLLGLPGSAEKFSLVVGFIAIPMTMLASLLMDGWGRRPLFITGLVGMAGSLALFVFYLASAPVASYVPLVAILFFLAFYSVSLSPLPTVCVTELYPASARTQCMTICLLTNWVANYAVSFSFLPLLDRFGLAPIFSCYGICCVLGLLWGMRYLPETKGKQLPA